MRVYDFDVTKILGAPSEFPEASAINRPPSKREDTGTGDVGVRPTKTIRKETRAIESSHTTTGITATPPRAHRAAAASCLQSRKHESPLLRFWAPCCRYNNSKACVYRKHRAQQEGRSGNVEALLAVSGVADSDREIETHG